MWESILKQARFIPTTCPPAKKWHCRSNKQNQNGVTCGHFMSEHTWRGRVPSSIPCCCHLSCLALSSLWPLLHRTGDQFPERQSCLFPPEQHQRGSEFVFLLLRITYHFCYWFNVRVFLLYFAILVEDHRSVPAFVPPSPFVWSQDAIAHFLFTY